MAALGSLGIANFFLGLNPVSIGISVIAGIFVNGYIQDAIDELVRQAKAKLPGKINDGARDALQAKLSDLGGSIENAGYLRSILFPEIHGRALSTTPSAIQVRESLEDLPPTCRQAASYNRTAVFYLSQNAGEGCRPDRIDGTCPCLAFEWPFVRLR